MKKSFAIIISMFIAASSCATPAFSQEWDKERLSKSPRHMDWVTVKAGARSVKTFVAYPEVKGKATTILLISEIFGLSDWVRETADELAAQGYVVVAPDVLSGTKDGGGTEKYANDDEARKAVSELPPAQVTSDLQACADYALKLPASNGKLAVVGFCWGGGQTFRFATNDSKPKSSYVFYGPTPDAASMSKITAPVLGFYAENDARITSTLEQTKADMAKAKKTFEPVVYKGAGHGFMRAGEAPDAKPADKQARTDAWKRLLESLKKI